MITVTCIQYTFKLYTDQWHLNLVRTEVYKAEDVPEDGNIIFCDLDEDTTYYYKIELLKHCVDSDGFIDVYTTATTYGSFTTDVFGFGEIEEWQYQCLGQPYDVTIAWDFDTTQIVLADEGLSIIWECTKGTKREIPIPDELMAKTVSENIQHCEVTLLGVYSKFNFIIRGHVESADYQTIEVIVPIENVIVEESESTEESTEQEEPLEP